MEAERSRAKRPRAGTEREEDGYDVPMSFVLNWYTPTRTPTVVARRTHVKARPRKGNLRGWR